MNASEQLSEANAQQQDFCAYLRSQIKPTKQGVIDSDELLMNVISELEVRGLWIK
jgi:hypothetical protein